MSDVILKVENLSKQYRLGTISTGTLSHDLNRFWHKIRGKSDPYLKIGDSNKQSELSDSSYTWALKDINFEVNRGEVLGIIGKNGAGKSTLLKILSRVTSPTSGELKTKGRIASLLEVGTGFHPELTGRENIYLNGAILGMTKDEIKSKIDEIIIFSGCQKYIDTPVKRYSSGMTVRLAFSVAAHLEPDILIVDEVLAVGDVEFQKKAIGKMQDISTGQGRTVLFVSHNMTAIQSLCNRVLIIKDGKIVNNSGDAPNVAVEKYLIYNRNQVDIKRERLDFNVSISQKSVYDFCEPFDIKMQIDSKIDETKKVFIDFAVINQFEEFVLHYRMDAQGEGISIGNEIKNLSFTVENPRLVLGEYALVVYIYDRMKNVLYWAENIAEFQISNLSNHLNTEGKIKSFIIPKVTIKL